MVCSCTGIVILFICDFGTEITLTDSAESYIGKKGEVEQHSRVGDYECLPRLLEQGPRERP